MSSDSPQEDPPERILKVVDSTPEEGPQGGAQGGTEGESQGGLRPSRGARYLWQHKRLSVLRLLPSGLTLLAMYLGFTTFYYSMEGRFEFVVGLVAAAAFLDMMDGRVARFLKQESKFGAELDSLADFLNFGVAPAFAMWLWGLNNFGRFGWVLAFFFVICCGLRLARFNATIDEDVNYGKQYFEGVPAPAGGLLVFMPMVLSFLGLENQIMLNILMLVFMIGVGALMVSSLPTYSLKKVRLHVPHNNFMLALLFASLGGVMIFNFPLPALLLLGVIYLASIPVTIYRYSKKD